MNALATTTWILPVSGKNGTLGKVMADLRRSFQNVSCFAGNTGKLVVVQSPRKGISAETALARYPQARVEETAPR